MAKNRQKMANFAQFSPKTPFFGKKSEKNGKKKSEKL